MPHPIADFKRSDAPGARSGVSAVRRLNLFAELETAFPRLLPLLTGRGLDRNTLQTHLTTALAQRETLAAQAEQHDRRGQLVQLRGALEGLMVGLQADDTGALKIAASDEFRNLLTQRGLSPDLPPPEAVAAAVAKVKADIAALDAASSA